MEVWKSVVEWEGFYEVSNEGRVRSIDRCHPSTNRNGEPCMRRQRGKALKPNQLKNGYLMVNLTRPGGERRYAYVHHLVAEAFLGPKPEGSEICHNDGTRMCNFDTNLRYDTRSANALDRHDHGTMNQAHGEEHYFRKLTDEDVRWARRMSGSISHRDMAGALGVTHGTVGRAIRGQNWKHVV